MNLLKVGPYLVEVRKSTLINHQISNNNTMMENTNNANSVSAATNNNNNNNAAAAHVIYYPAVHQSTNERCLFQFVSKACQKEVAALTKEVKVQMLAADHKELDILRLREVLQDGNHPPSNNNPSNQNAAAAAATKISATAARKRSFDRMDKDEDLSLDDSGSEDNGKGQTDGFPIPPPRYYLAFEGFAEGQGKDMLQYIKEQGRRSEHVAKGLFRSILQTIESLHGLGVVHGDLKLPNLLVYEDKVTGDLKVKVKDFRYSTILNPQLEGTQQQQQPQHIGGIGMITTHKGSPAYLAPEITVLNQPYCGKKADIYALGVILFTMLVGGYPITAPSLPTLLELIRKGTYTIPNFVSQEAADLINRLLEKDPQLRISPKEALKHPWFFTPSSGLKGTKESGNGSKTTAATLIIGSGADADDENDEQVVPGATTAAAAAIIKRTDGNMNKKNRVSYGQDSLERKIVLIKAPMAGN